MISNEQLQRFARNTIKLGLSKCDERMQLLFKRMYSPDNLDLPIDDVVDRIPEDKLNWAMQQVANTIKKFKLEVNH